MSLFGKEKERASSNRNPADESKWGFASFANQHEGKRIKARKVYSIWGAMKCTMVLSLLLWWLPLFGQMIAGYIGGRKAGSPLKGVIAALIPVVALFAFMTALDHFFLQSVSINGSASASLFAGFATGMPIIGPYLDFTRDYVMKFIDSLAGSAPYGMNSYVITLAFAYIGGILATQTRREIEAVSGEAGSHTTVVVAPNERADAGTNQAANTPNHNPLQLVGSFISGKMSSLKPSNGIGRKTRADSFDKMVAIRDVEGAQAEEEGDQATDSTDAHDGKQRTRKVRKLKAKPVMRTARAAPIRHERPAMVVSSNRPNTFRTAQRRIEKEWDPARKTRAVGSPPIIAQKHHMKHDANSVQGQARSNIVNRPPTRNFDTI